MAIVLGTRESRVQGEGPQLERRVRSHPPDHATYGVKAWESLPMSGKHSGPTNPLRRSPCAVKAARTVTTGGMRRRAARYRALSLPTADGEDSGASRLGSPGKGWWWCRPRR